MMIFRAILSWTKAPREWATPVFCPTEKGKNYLRSCRNNLVTEIIQLISFNLDIATWYQPPNVKKKKEITKKILSKYY